MRSSGTKPGDQDEPRRLGHRLAQRRIPLEQVWNPLLRVDPAGVEQEGPAVDDRHARPSRRQVDSVTEQRGLKRCRRIEPAHERHFRLGRAEQFRAGQPAADDGQVGRRFVVQRRHDEGPSALDGAEPVVGRRVEVGDEENAIVALAPEVRDDSGGDRPLAAEKLLLQCVGPGSHPSGEGSPHRGRKPGEGTRFEALVQQAAHRVPVRQSALRHRETVDSDAVDLLRSGGPTLAPLVVVACRRGQHLDVVFAGEQPRHERRMRLGPAEDLLAVTLDDDRDPHGTPQESAGRPSGPSASRKPRSIAAGAKSRA